jgi:iodotyrosine deiodinase
MAGRARPLGTDADKPFLETAPYLIVVFAQRKGGIAEDGQTQNYYVNESVGIACGMLLATLHEAGLATLTHTPSPMGFLREICGRPEWEKPLMIIVTGRPAAGATVPAMPCRKKPFADHQLALTLGCQAASSSGSAGLVASRS